MRTTQKPTTLSVRRTTRDRLRSFGAEGKSYDAILVRLMDVTESTFWERQVRILKESHFLSFQEA